MGPPRQITRQGRETLWGGGGALAGGGECASTHGHADLQPRAGGRGPRAWGRMPPGGGQAHSTTLPRDLQPGPPQPQGVSSAEEGGRGLLHAWGPVPRVLASSQRPRWQLHMSQNGTGEKWDPLGQGGGRAAKLLAVEVCLPHGFSHSPLPGTVLTRENPTGRRARVSHRSAKTQGQQGQALG